MWGTSPFRGAWICFSALLLLLVGLFGAPAGAQTNDGATDSPEGAGAEADLPSCRGRAGGLELATTLDFAGVARPFAASGAVDPDDADGTGDTEISSYELFCPYGELPVGADGDATAPLELTLRWAVLPALDGPGCTEDEQQDVAGGAVGTVADPDRRAQVDWATAEDGPTSEAAVEAAENLLTATPDDVVACDADVSGGGEAAAGDDSGDSTTTPLLVIIVAGLVALAALVVVLVRRSLSGRSQSETPAPEPVPAAQGATPGEIPLVDGPAAASALTSGAAAPPGPPDREAPPPARSAAPAGVAAQRDAAPGVRASRAGQLALVAQSCHLMARGDRDVIDAHVQRGLPVPGGTQLPALADALDALARGATQLARGEATAGAATGDPGRLDPLLAATTRLLHAHQALLGRPDPLEGP